MCARERVPVRLCCEAHELVLVLVSLSTESDSLEGRGGRQGRGRREEVSDPLVLVVVDEPRPVLVRSLPPCRHSIAVMPSRHPLHQLHCSDRALACVGRA